MNTHLGTDLSFIPLGRISGWMSEGVAEYIAISGTRKSFARRPVRPDHTNYRHYLADAAETGPPALRLPRAGRLYRERHGGLAGLLKFAQAYDTAQDLDAAPYGPSVSATCSSTSAGAPGWKATST